MRRTIAHVALVVHDYDEAIAFFTGAMAFRLVTEEPREEAYGTVVVFLDLYGNKWDLIQRRD